MIKLLGKGQKIASGFSYAKPIRNPSNCLDILRSAYLNDRLRWWPEQTNLFKFTPGRLFGIEIEAQNVQSDIISRVSNMLPQWQIVNDGSLKNNGKEFVSFALEGKDIYEQLYQLWTVFSLQKSELDFSWRTSSHVHVDGSTLSLEQLYKFLILYCIFENCLFEFAGNFRKKSPFCVPLTRTAFADSFWSTAVHGYGNIFDVIAMNDKYCALNLQHLGVGENSKRYGTIEFRHFPGAKKPLKFYNWIYMIDELIQSSITIPQEDILNAVISLNSTSEYFSFLTKVFPVMSSKLQTDNLKHNMEEGIKYCKQMLTEPFIVQHALTLKNSPAIRFFKPKVEGRKEVTPKTFFTGPPLPFINQDNEVPF